MTDTAQMEIGTTDPDMIGAEDAPAEAYVLEATLVSHNEAGGSASGGTRTTIKFEVHEEDLAQLVAAKVVGQRAFDVTFLRTKFGEGLTISAYNGRPDEDGAGRAWITLSVPENQSHLLAVIHTKKLTKKSGALILGPSQVTIDEVLTKKAE
jgi:hypothetical protein